jgi:acetyl esterase/lipase
MRRFWACCAIWGMSCVLPMDLSAESKPKLHTYVYKTVGDLKISADVYEYEDDKTRPAVVWIHGGALITGNRAGVSSSVRDMAFEKGYVLVSLDYRLAPETQLPGIIEDIEDAFLWLRTDGPKKFHIDPNRIAVTGGSAGGYLTLITGHRVKPRPQVLVAFWGYGDLVGDWYSKPSPHPRHLQIKSTREEAWKQVSGPPISDSRLRKGDGGKFYQYCRQTGEWPEAVTGWDPVKEPQKFAPFMPAKNVDAHYPPTVLIHGTVDTDVPYEQSLMMARELKKHGINHELISIPNAEHGLVGGDPKEIDAAYRRAFQFLKRELEVLSN